MRKCLSLHWNLNLDFSREVWEEANVYFFSGEAGTWTKITIYSALISRKNNSDITEMISETGRHNFNLWLNYSFKECLYPWFLLTVRFDFSFLRLSDFKDFTSLCYLWLVQINFTLLNCSREDLCCHSFGLDPLCKQLTCATVKTPHEQARMDRRDRPREERWEYIRTSGLHLSPWRQQRGWGLRDAQKTGGPTPPAAMTSNTCADALDKLSSSLSAAPSVLEVRSVCV